MTEHEAQRLQLSGELDLATCPAFAEQVARAFDSGARHLVLDLSQVSFMDSSGLRVIGDAVSRSREVGGTVTVDRPTAVVLRTMQVVGLDTLVELTGAPHDPR